MQRFNKKKLLNQVHLGQDVVEKLILYKGKGQKICLTPTQQFFSYIMGRTS